MLASNTSKRRSSLLLQSFGGIDLRSQVLAGSLLKSQDLGDSSLGDYHDGGLEVAGGQVGVDAAVDDELEDVSDRSGV